MSVSLVFRAATSHAPACALALTLAFAAPAPARADAARASSLVTFVRPPDVTELSVFFDERSVPVDALAKTYTVTAGPHHVHASGTKNGEPVVFDGDVDAKEGKLVTIALALAADPLERVQEELQYCAMSVDEHACVELERCLATSRTLEDRRACGDARHLQRTRACRACLISAHEPPPMGVVLLPLAAVARRFRRRRVLVNEPARARARGRGGA